MIHNPFYNLSSKRTKEIFAVAIIIVIALSSQLSAQPDLVVTSINITDGNGPVIGWSTTVKNQGNQASGGSVKLRMFITSSGFSQDFATWIKTTGLNAGESYTFTISSDLTGIPNVGKNTTYSTQAVVDPDNTIDETNESNNSMNGGSVTIIGPAPTISSITPTSGIKGSTVTVNGNNFGDTKSGYASAKLGSITSTTTSWSNTVVKFTIPLTAVVGTKYTIVMTTWSGTGNSSTQFEVKSSTAVKEINDAIVREFALKQNFPNPFNPSTTLEFSVPVSGLATLKVYTALGVEVSLLFNEVAEPGKIYQAEFNAEQLPSGIYFARLMHGNNLTAKKMMLLK